MRTLMMVYCPSGTSLSIPLEHPCPRKKSTRPPQADDEQKVLQAVLMLLERARGSKRLLLALLKVFWGWLPAFATSPLSIFTGNKLGERKTGALIGGGDEGQVRC
jgi:hypothetical protein